MVLNLHEFVEDGSVSGPAAFPKQSVLKEMEDLST